MSVIARRGLFQKATKTVRGLRASERALLQILLGHDRQRGERPFSLSQRLKHRRFPISIEKVDFPFRSLQKRVRGGGGREGETDGGIEGDVLRRARAAQQARSPTFECCCAPQRTG